MNTSKGDSGGPLVYKNSFGTWVQIGVVSFGSSDGCLAGPSGFTRVASYLYWIAGKIGELDQTISFQIKLIDYYGWTWSVPNMRNF